MKSRCRFEFHQSEERAGVLLIGHRKAALAPMPSMSMSAYGT